MDSPMHIAMYPWFAMGHFSPFLHLSNKLAKRGHKISFIVPKRTQTKLQHLNLHPHLITFIPITVPHVEALPHDAETTSDVPFPLFPLIATAMDCTQKDIELLLRDLRPQIVFFDFSHWLPSLTKRLGIKSLQYLIVAPVTVPFSLAHERQRNGRELTQLDLMELPSGFPDSSMFNLHAHEARTMVEFGKMKFGSGILFNDRLETGTRLCDAPNTTLEEKWVAWLEGFNPGSVIFCEYGSETTLQKNEFQEFLLGVESTGFPFLAALKPPNGFDSIEEALPEGFNERVKGRGIVYGGWVQQQLILEHPSVGCFITHCGAASVTEALVNKCQLVLLPRLGADHIMNARMMSLKLKVGVEVEKEKEDGMFTKESICKAVKIVMDDENEIGREVRENHTKLRNFLLSDNLESSCVDSFCEQLRGLL